MLSFGCFLFFKTVQPQLAMKEVKGRNIKSTVSTKRSIMGMIKLQVRREVKRVEGTRSIRKNTTNPITLIVRRKSRNVVAMCPACLCVGCVKGSVLPCPHLRSSTWATPPHLGSHDSGVLVHVPQTHGRHNSRQPSSGRKVFSLP